MPTKYSGFDFYKEVLGSPKRILAPMVDQSELAWRMLSRKYGADLCYTPMWHAGVFVRDANYRKDALESCPGDRPLIVQVIIHNLQHASHIKFFSPNNEYLGNSICKLFNFSN